MTPRSFRASRRARVDLARWSWAGAEKSARLSSAATLRRFVGRAVSTPPAHGFWRAKFPSRSKAPLARTHSTTLARRADARPAARERVAAPGSSVAARACAWSRPSAAGIDRKGPSGADGRSWGISGADFTFDPMGEWRVGFAFLFEKLCLAQFESTRPGSGWSLSFS